MHLKSSSWADSWKRYIQEASEQKKKFPLNEASPGFVHGVNRWIDTVTDGGEYTLNDVLPWGDMFDGALRVVIPAASEDDSNLAKIVTSLHMGGWSIPQLAGGGEGIKDFTVSTVKQKKRRLGTGEVYEEEIPVAKLDLERSQSKEIPKGPRAGEWVTKTEKTTMSRAINRLTKVNPDLDWYIPPELAEWWQKKQTFYTKGEHWKKIEKLFNEPTEDEMKPDQMIVLSRHPIDVLRMGDIETVGSFGTAGKIGHCHREGGEYAHCAQQEALGHGPIAYLVPKKEIDFLLSGENQEERTKNFLSGVGPGEPKHKLSDFDDREIFNDRDRDITGIKAINRLRLRQFRDNEINEMWAVPEKAVYPSFDAVPGFRTAVQKWAWDSQKDLYEKAYDPGKFPSFDSLERLGGKYADTRDGQLLNIFFNRSGKYPDYAPHEDVHHEREESEELEPDPEMIAEQWDFQIQEILDTINGRMDHSSVYAEVEVMDETPYVMMSAGLAVEFNEDLFGDDGGAEYEMPTSWNDTGYRDLTEEIRDALRNQIHVYSEEVDINEWGNTVSINFNVINEDYDPTPEGFDSFTDMVESEWDNNYDAIRKVIKRVLIAEGFMAPDAYEKLAQGLRAKAEERDLADAPAYKHWDFDEDGNEITFILKDPATLVAEPDFHGLYLGTIPKSMDLSYIFHDWKFRSSKEFEDKFIPRIRTLFADAEEAALRQLDLPGVEVKEMHGLLLPEKAEFRLKQVFDDYNAPAHIYLQVKIEIDEEITDMQVEEIQLFLKYLDEDSKIDLLQRGAEEAFQEFLQPALKKRVATDKVKKFGEAIQPLLKQTPLEQLMNFVGNLPLIDSRGFTRPTSVGSVTHEMASIIMKLAPRAQEGKPSNQYANELYRRWNLDTILKAAQQQAPMNLAPLLQDMHYSIGDFQSQEDVDEALEDLFKGVNKILGIRLQDSAGATTPGLSYRSDWNPGALLERLGELGTQLVVTGANHISYVFDLIMRDPKKAGGVEMLKKIMKPDYAPAWYTEELQKAGIASERIVDILPVSALDNPRTQEHEDATEELMKLLGVRESIIDRIDDKLNEGDPLSVGIDHPIHGGGPPDEEETPDEDRPWSLNDITTYRDLKRMGSALGRGAKSAGRAIAHPAKNIAGPLQQKIFGEPGPSPTPPSRVMDPQSGYEVESPRPSFMPGGSRGRYAQSGAEPMDIELYDAWSSRKPPAGQSTARGASTSTFGGARFEPWRTDRDRQRGEEAWRRLDGPVWEGDHLPGGWDRGTYPSDIDPEIQTRVEAGLSSGRFPPKEYLESVKTPHPEEVTRWFERQSPEYQKQNPLRYSDHYDPETKQRRPIAPADYYRTARQFTPRPDHRLRPAGSTEGPQYPDEREAYKRSYLEGTHRDVWLTKLEKENPDWSPEDIKKHYEKEILAPILTALKSPVIYKGYETRGGENENAFARAAATGIHAKSADPSGEGGYMSTPGKDVLAAPHGQTFEHEMAHIVAMGRDMSNTDEGRANWRLINKAFPTTSTPEQMKAWQESQHDVNARKPFYDLFPSHEDHPWEIYGTVLQTRLQMDKEYRAGRRETPYFTAKDIDNFKSLSHAYVLDAPTEREGAARQRRQDAAVEELPFLDQMMQSDIIKGLYKGRDKQTRTDQEIADILNQIALRQPKAKRDQPEARRQQPDRMVAESIVDRIDDKLDEEILPPWLAPLRGIGAGAKNLYDAGKQAITHPVKTAGAAQQRVFGEPSDLSAKYLGGTDRAAKTVTPAGKTGPWAEEHDAPPVAPEDLERSWKDMVRGVPIPHGRNLPDDVDYTDPRQRDAWASLSGPSAEEAADLDWSDTGFDDVPWEDVADWKSRYEYEYGSPQKWRGRAAKPEKRWDFEYTDTPGSPGHITASPTIARVTDPMSPEDFVTYKKKWIDSYTGGIAREVWEDKLGAENPTWSPKRITSFYKEKIMPGIVKKLEDVEFRTPDHGSLYGARGDFLPMRPTRVRDPATGRARGRGARIRLDPELLPTWQRPVVGHELGHTVDYPAVEGEDTLPSMSDRDAHADARGIASDILHGKGRTGKEPSGPRPSSLPGREFPALPITLSDFQADLIGAAFPSTKGKGHADPHEDRHWEMYASILNARVTSGRKFTPKDIGLMKLVADPRPARYRQGQQDVEDARKYIEKTFGRPADMIRAFEKEENLGKSNEEIADILNKIALRRPKAKRQQPDRMVAESIVDRINDKLNEASDDDDSQRKPEYVYSMTPQEMEEWEQWHESPGKRLGRKSVGLARDAILQPFGLNARRQARWMVNQADRATGTHPRDWPGALRDQGKEFTDLVQQKTQPIRRGVTEKLPPIAAAIRDQAAQNVGAITPEEATRRSDVRHAKAHPQTVTAGGSTTTRRGRAAAHDRARGLSAEGTWPETAIPVERKTRVPKSGYTKWDIINRERRGLPVEDISDVVTNVTEEWPAEDIETFLANPRSEQGWKGPAHGGQAQYPLGQAEDALGWSDSYGPPYSPWSTLNPPRFSRRGTPWRSGLPRYDLQGHEPRPAEGPATPEDLKTAQEYWRKYGAKEDPQDSLVLPEGTKYPESIVDRISEALGGLQEREYLSSEQEEEIFKDVLPKYGLELEKEPDPDPAYARPEHTGYVVEPERQLRGAPEADPYFLKRVDPLLRRMDRFLTPVARAVEKEFPGKSPEEIADIDRVAMKATKVPWALSPYGRLSAELVQYLSDRGIAPPGAHYDDPVNLRNLPTRDDEAPEPDLPKTPEDLERSRKEEEERIFGKEQ